MSTPARSIHTTSDGAESDFQSNGLKLELAPFGLEYIEDYGTGGHHPVHLGDLLGKNGRYHVIHKLGNGGFANVWLCRDIDCSNNTKYVALKVLLAELSRDDCPELRVSTLKDIKNRHEYTDEAGKYICLPLDQFEVKGPNGSHLCFAYPILGPPVTFGTLRDSQELERILRQICLGTVKAMAFLHSHNICHGDLTPRNVLHHITGINGLTEDEVLQRLGYPEKNKVLKVSSEDHAKPTAPQYLVYPVKWTGVDSRFISQQPCVIDFGESFEVSQPPRDLGIPGPYRSPELILDKTAGFGSDLWALAGTLFEIRTGRKLFSPFDDEDDEYLDAMVQVLGRLPEPWWSTTWGNRKRIYKDDADDQGRALAAVEPEEAPKLKENSGIISTIHPSVPVDPRSLDDMLKPGLWYMIDDYPGGQFHRDIQDDEREMFKDLLAGLLKYKPEDRTSAKDLLNHPWFQL